MEQRARFEKEAHLLLGFIHSSGMNTIRDLTASGAQQQSRAPPNSWLAQQRSNVRGVLRYTQPYLTFPNSLEHTFGDNPGRKSSLAWSQPHVHNYRTFFFSRNFFIPSVSGNGCLVDPGEECDHGALEWK